MYSCVCEAFLFFCASFSKYSLLLLYSNEIYHTTTGKWSVPVVGEFLILWRRQETWTIHTMWQPFVSATDCTKSNQFEFMRFVAIGSQNISRLTTDDLEWSRMTVARYWPNPPPPPTAFTGMLHEKNCRFEPMFDIFGNEPAILGRKCGKSRSLW